MIKKTIPAGFEPARAVHNRFQVCPLNRSGTVSNIKKEDLIYN